MVAFAWEAPRSVGDAEARAEPAAAGSHTGNRPLATAATPCGGRLSLEEGRRGEHSRPCSRSWLLGALPRCVAGSEGGHSPRRHRDDASRGCVGLRLNSWGEAASGKGRGYSPPRRQCRRLLGRSNQSSSGWSNDDDGHDPYQCFDSSCEGKEERRDD
jgi:hypothetical protein